MAEQFGDVLSTEGINDDLSAAFGGEGGALQQKTTQDGVWPLCAPMTLGVSLAPV